MENFHAEAYLRTLVEAVNNVQNLVIETKKNPTSAHENISAATAVACMTLSDLVESSGFKHFIEDSVHLAMEGSAGAPHPVQDEARWRAFLKWQRLAMLAEGMEDSVVEDAISRYWECYDQPGADVLMTRIRDMRETACHSSFIAKGHFSEVDAIRFVDRVGLGMLGLSVLTGAGHTGLTDPFLGGVMTPPAFWLGAGMIKKAVDSFKTQ